MVRQALDWLKMSEIQKGPIAENMKTLKSQ